MNQVGSARRYCLGWGGLGSQDRTWRDVEAADETERGLALLWRRGVLTDVVLSAKECHDDNGSTNPLGNLLPIFEKAIKTLQKGVFKHM